MLENYEDILTTEELANILRLNEKTIIKLVKEGKIPAMKIANQFRFSKDKIIDWLETHMNEFTDSQLSEIEKGLTQIAVHKILKEDLIKLDISSDNKFDVLTELVNLYDNTGIIQNKSEFLRLINIREKQFTTAIGKSIAFPHPRSSNNNLVNNILVVIGISKKGIDFGAFDNLPVNIVVLFASPKLSIHLQLLSHLTRIFNDDEVRKAVINAKNEKEIIEIIKNKEKKI